MLKRLFGREPVEAPKPMSFYAYAHLHLPISQGLAAVCAQAANEALRHCRIRSVTEKSKA